MKLVKKAIVSLVAVSMVAGVTGCVQKPQETASTGTTTEVKKDSKKDNKKDSENEKVVKPVSDDIWAPYEEPIKITTITPENGGIQWRDGDDYNNNPWYDAYKERFNIEVTNAWVSNDYNTKLNLTIAEGNLPDAFVVNYQQLQQLQEADMIWDMTDIFDEYASENVKGYRELEEATFETAMFDDRLYAIPQLSYGTIDQPIQLWVRRDLQEELGLEEPKTMDDLYNIAKAVQDEIGGHPIAETQDLDGFNALATGFGAQPGIWVEQEDGNIGYGSIQPEMKDALTEYAKWYQEGLISPDFTITDSTKMFQQLINGDAGIVPYYQWMGYNPGPDIIKNLGPEAVFDAYQIPSATGEPSKANINFANIGYVVVSKNCKNPEAIMKLMNFYSYLLDDAQDIESKEFMDSLFNDAYAVSVYAFRIINPMIDYNLYLDVVDKLAIGLEEDATELGTGQFKYYHSVDFIKNGTAESVGNYMQMGSPKSAYSVAQRQIENGDTVKNKVWGIQPETILNTGSTLKDILQEGFTKIIVGQEPIEYFDTLVTNWEKAGGAKATQEVNEMYNSN